MTAAIDRRRLTARLHVMKKEQGLDDDLYRDKLETITGKRSAAELSEDELRQAVARFGQSVRASAGAHLPATPQAKLIQALWLSLYNLGVVEDRSDGAILAFVRRQTKIDAARWLTRKDDILTVVEALKDWLAREGVDWTREKALPPFMVLPAYKVAVAQWRKLIELKVVTRGKTWSGNFTSADEEVTAYAAGIKTLTGKPSTWSNREWAQVNRALGHRIRRTGRKAFPRKTKVEQCSKESEIDIPAN